MGNARNEKRNHHKEVKFLNNGEWFRERHIAMRHHFASKVSELLIIYADDLGFGDLFALSIGSHACIAADVQCRCPEMT